MNNTKKPFGLLSLLGCFLTACAILCLSSCNTNDQKTVKIKNYLNWELEFTKDATEAEKIKAVDSVEVYILNHLNIEEYYGSILYSVTFKTSGIGQDRTEVGVELAFSNAGSQATPSPKPGGGPHHFSQPDSIPNIRHISINSPVE